MEKQTQLLNMKLSRIRVDSFSGHLCQEHYSSEIKTHGNDCHLFTRSQMHV